LTRRLANGLPLLVAWACADAGGRGAQSIQEVSRVEDVRPCDSASDACGIFWIRMGSIGGSGSPPGLDPVGAPAVDSRHRVYCPGWTPGVVVAWDMDGHVVGTLGRPGEGPGEMEGLAEALIGPGDTVHVRDNAGTWSVFSPELEFVRKMSHVALPPLNAVALTSDGHMVAAWGTPLFRVIKPDGRDSLRFGVPDAAEILPRRVLAAGRRSGRFWASPAYRLAITEWGLDGTEYRRVAVRGSAFPDQPSDETWDPHAGKAPSAILNRLVEDAQGLLWVWAILPEPDYTPSLRDAQDQSLARVNHMYRFLVEVIDPATGTVVASAIAGTMEESVSGILPGPTGYRVIEDQWGVMRYDFGKLVVGALGAHRTSGTGH
jgi:hypothetical protein